jgi:hypothetical protein
MRNGGSDVKKHLAAGLAIALLAVVACATTRITSTWRDPGIGPVQFRKVVGIALTQDATLRRVAEDEFVRTVGPDQAIAGYTVLPDTEMRDRAIVQARVEAAGADGAVVFRLANVETQERWVPPTTYGNAWGYWGFAAPLVYEPGYLTTDRIVQVETTVYNVADARLVWAARSETLNPSDAQSLIDDVVRAVVAEMREAKLLP